MYMVNIPAKARRSTKQNPPRPWRSQTADRTPAPLHNTRITSHPLLCWDQTARYLNPWFFRHLEIIVSSRIIESDPRTRHLKAHQLIFNEAPHDEA